MNIKQQNSCVFTFNRFLKHVQLQSYVFPILTIWESCVQRRPKEEFVLLTRLSDRIFYFPYVLVWMRRTIVSNKIWNRRIETDTPHASVKKFDKHPNFRFGRIRILVLNFSDFLVNSTKTGLNCKFKPGRNSPNEFQRILNPCAHTRHTTTGDWNLSPSSDPTKKKKRFPSYQ
jgi:hypothetical protein